MFELHIEQGPILEAAGDTIGIVDGVQGMRWYDVTIVGSESHTRSTPMHLCRNALLAAAKIVQDVDAIAKEHSGSVGTVGQSEVKPNSRNGYPWGSFSHRRLPSSPGIGTGLDEGDLAKAIMVVAEKTKTGIDCKRIWRSEPVKFDPECVACVRQGAAAADLPARTITSGPGHDAAYIARVALTAMIFVPCKGGISHNEIESTTFAECAAGAQMLLNAVLAYDRRFASI
jgi:beta-ureidopropionase / N-carbamoyl-L-amino-acid hydrolase